MSSKSVGGPCGHKFQLELFSVEKCLEFPGPSAPGVVKSRQEGAIDLVALSLLFPSQLKVLP